MYRCTWCGEMIDTPSCRSEIDGFDERNRAVVMQTFFCPSCGETALEWIEEVEDISDPVLDKMVEERREREEILNEW